MNHRKSAFIKLRYPGPLERYEALATCTDAERLALVDITGEDFNPVPDFPIEPPKGPGREWSLSDPQELRDLIAYIMSGGNPGHKIFGRDKK